jgi:hypothetical protein
MSLLKQILNTKLSEDESTPLIAATPQNKASTSFSLLQNIHGSELTAGDVTNHLHAVDDADEHVDTVAFGLETTDGEIVKVYVNAEEAEAFEQRMSQLLGKIDDIDQAIEELSNEFDIVSVVKPGEMDAQEVGLNGENPEGEESPEVGIENRLDEPLTDDDIVQDMDGEDLIDDESEKKKKDDKKDDDKKDDEPEDDSEAEDDKGAEGEDDGLNFGDETEGEDKPEDEEGEDKPEDESESEDDSDTEGDDDSNTEEDSEDKDTEEDDPEDDPENKDKDKKKDKKKSKDKEDKMKQESKSLLQQLVSLNEAKAEHKKPVAKKVEVKHEEPKKSDVQPDDSADVFHIALSKDEEELSKIFATPVQQLIYRTILLLGVNADQINIRKFKVRRGVKDVATMIQHHPQIKNILTKLGKDLASKKSEIHKITEAEEKEEKVQGTIKDQLSTEISKKIYGLILALGVPEFLLTYKKTAFRNRIKNLAKIAVKHSRIKTYIYMLSDLLKAEHKSALKEGYEAAKVEIEAKAESEIVEVEYKSSGLLEDFSKTDNAADLGTFTVVSMGSVGGTTIKVKDFSVEFDEEQFEKFVKILGDGKSGVIKSENLGKVNVISLARGKEYVIKSVKPGHNDKYPFGVVLSAKSIDKILG